MKSRIQSSRNRIAVLTSSRPKTSSSSLPQTKEDHVSFVALVQDDRWEIVRLYPEWDVNVYLKKRGRGKAMLYFFRTGNRRLFRQQI